MEKKEKSRSFSGMHTYSRSAKLKKENENICFNTSNLADYLKRVVVYYFSRFPMFSAAFYHSVYPVIVVN